MSNAAQSAVKIARDYYDSDDADNFYAAVWGGEDIHIGLYDGAASIKEASRNTVLHMAERLSGLSSGARVLDIGAGYGGAARVLAERFGARVSCLNLSRVENERNERLTAQQGLDSLIDVVEGSFESIPEGDATFDIVWSQDAILHAGDRRKALSEVARVLKPGGEFIFTDPMQADDLADAAALQPIYDRIHLDSLASFSFYRSTLADLGFREIAVETLTPHMRVHYARVAEELEKRRRELEETVSSDYIDRMLQGLQHWVDGADNGRLVWGVLHFQKT